LRGSNLLPTTPLLGALVQLHGPQEKLELSGSKCAVQSLNVTTSRYSVQLDGGGQPFMLGD